MTIFIAAIIAMIVGAVWYGPLFGKRWMEICGMDSIPEGQKKEAQKAMTASYAIQFFLTLLQIYILVGFLNEVAEVGENSNALSTALWLWFGFIMPTIAASALWNSNPVRLKWAAFLIQAGYQFVLFIIYGLIFAK